jgi:hypothetical protein
MSRVEHPSPIGRFQRFDGLLAPSLVSIGHRSQHRHRLAVLGDGEAFSLRHPLQQGRQVGFRFEGAEGDDFNQCPTS